MSTSQSPVRNLPARRPPVLDRAAAVSGGTWILVGLVALAAAIRIVTVDNQSYWADEALTAFEARSSFTGMLHTVASVETTPPLYFVVIWVWAKLFGTGEVALRSISALAGVAIVPVAYLCARELVDRRAGLLAAAFMAVNPFIIWYSQEARAYMLVALLSGVSFLWFIRARREPSARNLAWWAGFSAAAVMTHFFAGFAVAPEAVWLLWIARRRATVIAVAAVAAAQVAMLPFAVADAAASRGVGWIGSISRVTRIAQTVIEWGASNLYRRTTTPEGLIVGALLAVILMLLLGPGGDRRARQAAKMAGAVAGCAFLLPLAIGFVGQDYFLPRNEIPAAVPVATLLAAACSAPRARAAGAALAVTLLAVFGVTAIDVQTHPYLQRPNWRDVARSIGTGELPRAVLAADGTTADPLKIYLPGVSWSQAPGQPVFIREIDVIGATKKLHLVVTAAQERREIATDDLGGVPSGAPVPRSISVPGATLVARFKVANWVVARFVLTRPHRVSPNQLTRIAGRYFRRTPRALLVFVQRRVH